MTSPGWYPDPTQVDTVRYFNGSEWTEQTAPAPAKQTGGSGLVPGMVFGAIFPVVGFVWGLVCMMRGYAMDGFTLWLWSLVWALAWIVVALLIGRS